MKKTIFTFMMVLLLSIQAYAQTLEQSIQSEGQKFVSSTILVNPDIALRYTPPKLIELSGGVVAFKNMFKTGVEQLNKQGLEIKQIIVEKPIAVKKVKNKTCAILPQQIIIAIPEGKLIQVGYLFAVQEQRAGEWYFVDISALKNEQVRNLFPEINMFEIPASTAPQYINKFDGLPLRKARAGYKTKLREKLKTKRPVDQPPVGLFNIVTYKSPVGNLKAYLSIPEKPGKKYPAIIWLFGGFSNSIGSTAWTSGPPENDQSACAFRKKGIIMMYPSLRGGNNNPGVVEGLYGEIDDVIAAFEFLARQPFVDKNRIYLGGHSTGGTLALLVAEYTDKFRAVFSLGPVGDLRSYGEEYFNFDVTSSDEWDLRAPVQYLNYIKTPTFVFEGSEGNIEPLKNLRRSTKNVLVKFYEIKNADHFNVIVPTTKIIANKINNDTAEIVGIQFTKKELKIR